MSEQRDCPHVVGVLLTHATSGPPLAIGLFVGGTSVLVGHFATARVMLPGWADPLNLCLYACLYLAPLSVASAALCSGWMVRNGTFALAESAPDGLWRVARLTAVTTWVWAISSYGAFVGVVLLSSDLNGPKTSGMLLLPVQAVVLLTAANCVGAVLGAAVTANWFPPIAAIVTFLALFLLDIDAGPLDRYSPTYSGVAYRVNTTPHAILLVGVTLVLVGVGLFAVGANRVQGNRRTGAAILAATFVFVIAGVTTVHRAGPGDVAYRTGGPAACLAEQEIELCVFPESKSQLEPMSAALATAVELASPLWTVPHRFYQPSVDSPLSRPQPVDIPPNAERGGYLVRAVAAIVPGSTCTRDSKDYIELTGLLFERFRDGSTGNPFLRKVAGEPLAMQRSWADIRLDRLRHCR